MGEQKVYEELLNVFPKYKQSDLFTYKLAIKKPTILVNAKQLGLKMLEEWEQKSTLMLLQGSSTSMDTLDLDSSPGHLEDRPRPTNNSEYDNLFG